MNNRTLMTLDLVDNHYGDTYRATILQPYTEEQLALLRQYSECTLEELKKRDVQVLSNETPGALRDGVAQDDWVYRVQERSDTAYIETGNCMGVLRLHDRKTGADVILKIRSRFDTDAKQYFLVYLLSKCFGGEFLKDMEIPTDGHDMWDLLVALLFRKQLQDACKVGLYREYRENRHNDLRYRGKFDLDTHLKRNNPFIGNIAYTTRDISFDNPLNHLVRHAIEKLRRKWPWLMKDGFEFTNLVHLFEQSTPTWQSRDVWQCVHNRQNRVSVKHPYYAPHYEPLRQLALALLHEEGMNPYDASANEIEGFIFDGAWLWEEYLNTIFGPLGFNHPRNKDKAGALSYFENGTGAIYPDFWKDGMVIDAKYKQLQLGIDSDDYAQIISYMHVLSAPQGFFVYPISERKVKKGDLLITSNTLQGQGGIVSTISLMIPADYSCYSEFSVLMDEQEKKLKSTLPAPKTSSI